MMTITEVETLKAALTADGTPKPEIIRRIAEACLGWPYVYGAWGEPCTPSNRKRRARDDHPTIKSKCPALNGRSCTACQWGIGVREFDCRGFTRWTLQQVGLDITGQGATSQYNTATNWIRRGKISEMPDCVCCVFKQKGKTMEHTGLHIGGGEIIHCSVNVQTGKTSDRGWTHYAIPTGLYSEEEIPVTTVKPTIRKGSRGPEVVELQEILTQCGYNCGAVDGVFGTKTYNALVLFQTEAKLDPDGVCGPKTWKALAVAEAQAPIAPGEPVTYTVICHSMTWQQAMKIRETCPTAEMVKEG